MQWFHLYWLHETDIFKRHYDFLNMKHKENIWRMFRLGTWALDPRSSRTFAPPDRSIIMVLSAAFVHCTLQGMEIVWILISYSFQRIKIADLSWYHKIIDERLLFGSDVAIIILNINVSSFCFIYWIYIM